MDSFQPRLGIVAVQEAAKSVARCAHCQGNRNMSNMVCVLVTTNSQTDQLNPGTLGTNLMLGRESQSRLTSNDPSLLSRHICNDSRPEHYRNKIKIVSRDTEIYTSRSVVHSTGRSTNHNLSETDSNHALPALTLGA
ncbi:hypothetical protein NP493_1524g00021 [Ridgeia piscesae]|uniref:Uncharacterized protein n=1 Tax=Ridgeia piscesae TaxID=27915 RepID=A0AAD9K1X1_RIDPI|nr:hypothetical protein NP493_1524g00021 [Ridgeia piscesae]